MVNCKCWHATNRGPNGETLKHPSGFDCERCKNGGVVVKPLERDPANPYDHYFENDNPDEVGYYDSSGRLRRR